MNENARRLLGAVVGGAVGVLAYWVMLRSAWYMPGVAGIGLALGVSAASRSRRIGWGIVTALLAALLSLVADWWFRPFLADASLGYYLQHLGDLSRLTQVSLVAAPLLGFYFGMGRTPRGAARGTA